MNMVPELPNISDSAKYSVKQTIELLGVSRTFLWQKTKEGEIKIESGRNGRKVYRGKAIKNFHRTY